MLCLAVRNRPEVSGCHSEQQNKTIGQVLLIRSKVKTMASRNADSHADQYASERDVSTLALHGVTALGASAAVTASAASTACTTSSTITIAVVGAGAGLEQAEKARASRT